MTRVLTTALLMATAILLSAFPLFAQTPRTISYQGILADGSGNFLPDGIHAVSISIYDTPTGGSALFTETASVTVVRGVFNVICDCPSAAVLNTSESEQGTFVPGLMSGVNTPPNVSMPNASVVVRLTPTIGVLSSTTKDWRLCE